MNGPRTFHYARSEHERELLRLLARGEQEISEGTGYALDEVLKEADSLLAAGKPESPLDVEGVNLKLTADEIVGMVREIRRR